MGRHKVLYQQILGGIMKEEMKKWLQDRLECARTEIKKSTANLKNKMAKRN